MLEAQCVIDQCTQVSLAPRAERCFEHPALQTGIDEIAIERGLILEIDLAAALAQLVDRRLGNKQVTAPDAPGHRSEERRVGKECVRPVRARGAPDRKKKK